MIRVLFRILIGAALILAGGKLIIIGISATGLLVFVAIPGLILAAVGCFVLLAGT